MTDERHTDSNPPDAAHRFEDFTEDLVIWVIFYGPEGGEKE